MSASKAPASKDRRKSEKSPGLITLTVTPLKLRAIFADSDVDSASVAATSTPAPVKDEDSTSTAKDSPAAPFNMASNNATPLHDSASDSTPNTPGGPIGIEGFELKPSMAPPVAEESTKKKGVKRTAAAAGIDGTGSNGPGSTNGDAAAPKARSKPGPKKKAKLDDGAGDTGRTGGGGSHKLGPKASMGAINAGLRALDRSGKPCRKWAKGGFHLKTFTGVVWEIPRWTAPPKPVHETSSTEESTTATASANGSNKENKGSKEASEKTVDGVKSGQANGVNGTVNGTANGVVNGAVNGAANGTATNGDAKGLVNGTHANSSVDVDMDSAPPSTQPSPPPTTTEPATPAAAAVAVAVA